MARRYEEPKRPRSRKERTARFFGVAAGTLLCVECVTSGLLMLLAFAVLGKPGHPPGGAIEMILALAVVAVLSPIALLSGSVGLLLDDQRWLRWVLISHATLIVAAQLFASWFLGMRCLLWMVPFRTYC